MQQPRQIQRREVLEAIERRMSEFPEMRSFYRREAENVVETFRTAADVRGLLDDQTDALVAGLAPDAPVEVI